MIIVVITFFSIDIHNIQSHKKLLEEDPCKICSERGNYCFSEERFEYVRNKLNMELGNARFLNKTNDIKTYTSDLNCIELLRDQIIIK